MWYKIAQMLGSNSSNLSLRSQNWFLRDTGNESPSNKNETEKISDEDISPQPLSEDWIENAKSWIGTPYVFGGNSKSGIDCSAFIQKVFPDKNLPRTARDQQKIGSDIDPKDISKWEPGDRIYFDMNARLGSGNNIADHTGVYLGNNEFIQASSSKGVTVSNIAPDSFYFKKTIAVKR